jgi:hypothetical protein
MRKVIASVGGRQISCGNCVQSQRAVTLLALLHAEAECACTSRGTHVLTLHSCVITYVEEQDRANQHSDSLTSKLRIHQVAHMHACTHAHVAFRAHTPVSSASKGPLTTATVLSDDTAVIFTGAVGGVSSATGINAKLPGCTSKLRTPITTAGPRTDTGILSRACAPCHARG